MQQRNCTTVRVCAKRLSRSWPVPFSIIFVVKFSHGRLLLKWTAVVVQILMKSCRPLHDLVQVFVRRSCGNPGVVFSERSWHEDLADAASCRGAYMWALVGRSWGVPDLVRSAPAATGPFMTIARAWRSWSRSFTSPCEKLLWRSHAVRGLCMVLCRSLWEAREL